MVELYFKGVYLRFAQDWNCSRIIRAKGKKSRIGHECPKCKLQFFHMTKLVEHLKNYHGIENAFNCDECGKAFRSPMNITRHKVIHTGQKKFSCDVCEYTSNQKTNLELHKRRHTKDYSFKCHLCNKGFLSRTELVEHENTHVNVKPYRCGSCAKSYSYKKNLIAHLRQSHLERFDSNISTKTRDSNYKCRICSREFVLLKFLKDHMKCHGSLSSHVLCDICGIQLSCKSVLDVHKRTHSGEKIAGCDICGKGFPTKEQLKVHRRSHTGEKPYTCNQCGKQFAQRTSLVIHLRYHNDERPYCCPDCGKGFVSRNFLKNHRKIHNNISNTSLQFNTKCFE